METPSSTATDLHQGNNLVLEAGYLDTAGQPVSAEKVAAVTEACKTTQAAAGTPESQQEFLACFPKSGIAEKYADVIPESQAWQMHLVDVAIFGALAVLLVAGTVWALRRQS